MSTPPSDLPEMEYRFLGRSGLQISEISIGGWLTYGGHVEDGMFTFSALICSIPFSFLAPMYSPLRAMLLLSSHGHNATSPNRISHLGYAILP